MWTPEFAHCRAGSLSETQFGALTRRRQLPGHPQHASIISGTFSRQFTSAALCSLLPSLGAICAAASASLSTNWVKLIGLFSFFPSFLLFWSTHHLHTGVVLNWRWSGKKEGAAEYWGVSVCAHNHEGVRVSFQPLGRRVLFYMCETQVRTHAEPSNGTQVKKKIWKKQETGSKTFKKGK